MLIHLLLFALSSAFALAQQRSTQCPDRFPGIDPPPVRLANADTASDNLRESIAAIFSGDDYVCTGALISASWVLTSSRCPVSDMSRVVIGVRDLADAMPDDFLAVTQTFTREVSVAGGDKSGIVLLRLDTSDTAAGRPLSVNVALTVPRVNTYARVVGFGATSEDDDATADGMRGIMKQADIPVLENDKCDLEPPPDFKVALCAGYKKKDSCGPCFRDFGAPLLQYGPDKLPVVVGVTQNFACARKASHVFLRISVFTEALEDLQEEGLEIMVTENIRDEEVSSSLSTGVIVGIAVGAVVALLLVAAIIALIIQGRRRKKRKIPVPPNPASLNPAFATQPLINTPDNDSGNPDSVTSDPWRAAVSPNPAPSDVPSDPSQGTFVVPAPPPPINPALHQAPVAAVPAHEYAAPHEYGQPQEYGQSQEYAPQQFAQPGFVTSAPTQGQSGFAAPAPSPGQPANDSQW